jgi:PAS domain S-box-containing protein
MLSSDEPLDRRERLWRGIFVAAVVVILGFAVWCVDMVLSAQALRTKLEANVGLLFALDELDLSIQRGENDDTLVEESATLVRAFAARVQAEDHTPAMDSALAQLEAAVIPEPDPLLAAEHIDALRREIRGSNGMISRELGASWSGLIFAALASLLFAAAAIVTASVARRRSHEARIFAGRLGQSEALNRAIVELAGDVIMTLREDGTIAAVNRAGSACFGHQSAEELIGKPLQRIIPEVGPNLTETPGEPLLLTARRSDGTTFPAALSLAPLAHEELRRFILVLRDNSADERIKATMRAARDNALAAAEAKSDFLASMSHELRTPLTAIVGFSELLREDALEAGDDEKVEDLTRILKASDTLIGLIDDILDLSKIEAGRLDLSLAPLRVRDLVDELRDTAELLASKRSNKLICTLEEPLGEVVADRRRVHQVLLNLLSNAAKYTHDGLITFTTRRLRRDGRSWIVYSVQDTGVGISREALSRLFKPFERGDRSTRKHFKGTGLGLAISQRLVEHMGGTIRAESELDVGSTFTVEMPTSPIAPQPS